MVVSRSELKQGVTSSLAQLLLMCNVRTLLWQQEENGNKGRAMRYLDVQR